MKSLHQLPPAEPADSRQAPGCDTIADGTPACCAPEEPRLAAQGWTRRFVGDARMTEESTVLYSRLGYEVMAIPLGDAAVGDQCAGCADTLRGFSVVYTRRPQV